jgi:type 1 glutamine amidotransferase
MTRRSFRASSFIAAIVFAAGCSTGAASHSGGAGAEGAAAGATGGGPGAAGASAGTGAAGDIAPGGASGGGGVSAVAGAGTAGAEAGTSGNAGGTAGEQGNAGAGAGGAGGSSATDAGPSDGAWGGTARGNRVLIYTRATGFVHDSTPTAAAAITKSAAAFGLECETSQDQTKFTAAGLAPYAAIVLLATTGEPFGSPGTAQIQALVDWVQGGGGLVAIENADHAYDNSVPYISLIGGDFNGHQGYGPDTCYSDGMHPTNAKLPAMFPVVDEIYYTSKFNTENQVVLRCGSDKRAISWVRQQGAGRVFYTALGHDNHSWTMPPLVDDHVVPGLLWTIGR